MPLFRRGNRLKWDSDRQRLVFRTSVVVISCDPRLIELKVRETDETVLNTEKPSKFAKKHDADLTVKGWICIEYEDKLQDMWVDWTRMNNLLKTVTVPKCFIQIGEDFGMETSWNHLTGLQGNCTFGWSSGDGFKVGGKTVAGNCMGDKVFIKGHGEFDLKYERIQEQLRKMLTEPVYRSKYPTLKPFEPSAPVEDPKTEKVEKVEPSAPVEDGEKECVVCLDARATHGIVGPEFCKVTCCEYCIGQVNGACPETRVKGSPLRIY